MLTSAGSSKKDASTNEEFSKSLMGSDYYYASYFDKLIKDTVKELKSSHSDDTVKQSQRVYENMMTYSKQHGRFYELLYLNKFNQVLNEFTLQSQHGIRVLFSPLSKILTIHYISPNPFQLSDKKANQEVWAWAEAQASEKVQYKWLFLERN